jgi:UDP-glucose 4-epimerase
MKIVITGAKGYIGSVIAEKLAEHNPSCLDIEDWDIRNPFPEVYADVDCVIHCAALVKVGESVSMPMKYYDTNVNGTVNVIKAFPNAKMIFASTGAAFNPTSPYAYSKLLAENQIKKLCKEYTIFRFFNVGGRVPSNSEGLFAATQNAIKNKVFTIFGNDYNTKDGTCVRDYVHVDDLADAIVKATFSDAAMTNYEPIGSGKSYTVKEYVEKFLEVNGNLFDIKYSPRRPGDNEKSEVPFMSKFMQPTKTLEDIVKL